MRGKCDLKKNIIPKKYIHNINNSIANIMRNFVAPKYAKKDNSDLFKLVTSKSRKLRGNLYKCFSKFTSCIEILGEKNIKKYLKKKKFYNPVLVAYSIVVMEPNIKNYLFPIHQDLKHRLSKNSLLIWIPLNKSVKGELGGLKVYQNSDKYGPLPHEIGENGIMQLKKKSLKKINNLKEISFVDYQVGDAIFLSPFMCHGSIPNKSLTKSRWTLVISIDDITSSAHLSKSMHPFNINKYSTSLLNEDVRKLSDFMSKKQIRKVRK